MKYIEIVEPGGPDVLKLADGDTPEPGPGQVLIRVSAAGVNRPDVLQRMGAYPPPPGASGVPGLEVAGEVVATGTGVSSIKTGDQVCALLHSGGYAEFTLADAALCLPVPASLTPVEAAGLPECFFTVWSNLFDRAGLAAGETLLVHGGSSGIGTTAIQMAAALGARVFVTAGSAVKCEACLGLGADLAIDYHSSDFVAECLHATDGRGVDVILDMVLGDYLERNMQAAANDGRIVIIAALGGIKPAANFQALLKKRLTITGSTLRPRSVEFKSAIADSLKKHVWPLLENGRIRPVIYRTYPLAQAAEAHQLMESSQHIGKIILTT